MTYKIKLQLFEGPLDLLLYLVKKDQLNIYDIPIAQVTEQYIQYLELMKSLDLNLAGEFLVMAATLMQIKSKMLLPAQETDVVEEEGEDPRAELVRKLLEYERFKEIARELREREASQKELFRRQKTGLDEKDMVADEEKPQYFEASIFDLIDAFSKALKDAPRELFYQVIKDEFTVAEKTHQLLHLMMLNKTVNVSELFSRAKDKIEVIVIFLSILELIKMKEIVIIQKELFGEIAIVRNEANIIPYAKREQG